MPYDNLSLLNKSFYHSKLLIKYFKYDKLKVPAALSAAGISDKGGIAARVEVKNFRFYINLFCISNELRGCNLIGKVPDF